MKRYESSSFLLNSCYKIQATHSFDEGKQCRYTKALLNVHMCSAGNTRLLNYIGDVPEERHLEQ